MIVTTKLETASSPIRTRINETLYAIELDVKAKSEADQMKNEREEYFEEYYDFSYGVNRYDNEVGISSDTAFLAIEIVSAKANYDKRIKRLEGRYRRFESIMSYLSTVEAETFRRALFTSDLIDSIQLKSIIRKHLKQIESYYKEDQAEPESNRNERMERNEFMLKKFGKVGCL